MNDVTSRELLIHALTGAADFEHAVMCQYLFAAFSIKSDPSEGGLSWPQAETLREWKASLLLVARQEMEHLGLVCNLLTAIGGMPAFRPPAFPSQAILCPEIDAFDLRPLSVETLVRFMHIEKMHSDTANSDQRTIASLYADIKEGFKRLAQENALTFVGASQGQVTNATMGLRQGLYDVRMTAVVDLASANRAIDQIVEAGDGPVDPEELTHYRRFECVRDEFGILSSQDPLFRPTREVAINPSTFSGQGKSEILHPVTRLAAKLFNMAFSTQLLLLTRFFTPTDETPAERDGLRKLAFFPMMTMILRPLGEMLTLMPLGETEAHPTAGPCFEPYLDLVLPPNKEMAWILLHERLKNMARTCSLLCTALENHPTLPVKRFLFLHQNIERMAINFEHFANLRESNLTYLLKHLI